MKPIVFGKSVQGASHIRSETECQDSFGSKICDNGTAIMAVADGHGSKSCPFSKAGSQIAVNVFCKVLADYVASFADSPETLLTYLNREGDTKVAQEIHEEWKRRVLRNHRDHKRDMPQDEDAGKRNQKIFAQYGTTLLGLMLAENFLFAFQIGDGDIVFASPDGFESVVTAEKILGVETHSLSKMDAWKKAITVVRRVDFNEKLPSMFLMSSDGFANSYKNEEEFAKTCIDYFNMTNQYGTEAVGENLKSWLTETSAMGCGDDITVLMAYYCNDAEEHSSQENEISDSVEMLDESPAALEPSTESEVIPHE